MEQEPGKGEAQSQTTEVPVEALQEKTMLAEKHVAWIRGLVIIAATAAFLVMDKTHAIVWLAYLLLIPIWLYGAYVLIAEPYRKYPVFRAAWFTYTSDSIFATVWLFATGGVHSPFFLLFYTSIIAVAFRFSMRVTLITATIYTACYLGLTAAMRQVEGYEGDLLARTSLIYIIGYFASLITKETLEQVEAKHLIKAFNVQLEEKVQQRTRELEQSLKLMEGILETIPQMAWLSQPDGNVTYLNKAWYDFTGAKELTGWKWENHISKEDHKRTFDTWTECLRTGQPYEIEYRWVRHDGKERWMLGRANPVTDNEGNIVMWVGTATDIHEQKVQQQRKDDFMSIASHELKTPLTTMKAYIQLLDMKMKDSQEISGYTKKISDMVEKLNGLVSELLDVSKIQTGKLQFYITEFDFDEMVTECIEHVQHTTDTHKIIKKGELNVTVKGDRQRLEQVLNNYLTNAIKYSPKANEVLVELGRENDMLTVAVKDYGIGIPQEKLPRIFERFYRVEGLETRFQGLGIGLYIASEIVRRHNGTVNVRSEEGRGSVFTFSIPLEHTPV